MNRVRGGLIPCPECLAKVRKRKQELATENPRLAQAKVWHDTVRHATGQIRQVLDTIKADLLAAEAHGDPVVADFLRQTLVQCERPATPVPGIETRTERNDEESTQ